VPFGLHVSVTQAEWTPPWIADAEHPVLQLTGQALSRGFGGVDPLFMGAGGTVGLMATMHEATGGAPALLLGIDDPDTNLHGPNEVLHIPTFSGDRNGLIHLLFSMSSARRIP
jgi:acetylornithine deacetylase/succinyl-diaminopimelate desuccinylase-like protein